MIADGHVSLSLGFVWVCMSYILTLLPPQGFALTERLSLHDLYSKAHNYQRRPYSGPFTPFDLISVSFLNESKYVLGHNQFYYTEGLCVGLGNHQRPQAMTAGLLGW